MANTLLITTLLITVIGIHFCLANHSQIDDYEHLRQFFKQLNGHGPSSNSSSANSDAYVNNAVVPNFILWCILLFALVALVIIICCIIRMWIRKMNPVANFNAKNKDESAL
ncbi:hypothetical protein niasHS_009145 [Heterodera schachtii]|uniref:Uncharacterized protein n=1 Tax=Heterodera schachtii TaxID=97005 RepID=A0ABD2JEH0_HETSC